MGSEHTYLACTAQQIAGLVRLRQEHRERLDTTGCNDRHLCRRDADRTDQLIKEARALFGPAPASCGGTLATREHYVSAGRSIHWINARAHTFYDRQERPLRMPSSNIGITDRKKYEEE
jgi:PAS domain-containing protein